MKEIPFTEFPANTKEVTLENITYKFLFVWNSRMEAWTISIFTVDDVLILGGVKIVLNYELIRKFRHLAIPQGALYAIDLTNDESKIAFDDFTTSGRDLSLLYVEEDEVDSI